jgi:hypothetical protein
MGKWSRKPDDAEYKLSAENAELAVREFVEFYNISPDDEDPVHEDEAKARRGIERTLNKLQEYYRLGKIENRRDETLGFCVVQHTSKGSEITYRELKVKDKTALDGYKDTQVYARVNALMGRLSGIGEDGITKISPPDYQVTEALAICFLLA